MRLDELIDEVIGAASKDAPLEYAVQVSFDGNCFHVDRVEIGSDGVFRIYVEK